MDYDMLRSLPKKTLSSYVTQVGRTAYRRDWGLRNKLKGDYQPIANKTLSRITNEKGYIDFKNLANLSRRELLSRLKNYQQYLTKETSTIKGYRSYVEQRERFVNNIIKNNEKLQELEGQGVDIKLFYEVYDELYNTGSIYRNMKYEVMEMIVEKMNDKPTLNASEIAKEIVDNVIDLLDKK